MRHYLDHAATTPMLAEAVTTMTALLASTGNASSLHTAGHATRRVVEEAREQLAAALGARPSELVFTSGGTESDNLAIKGLYWARRHADPARVRLLCSPVEHPAVLETVAWLAEYQGARVEWLPVDPLGRVHPQALREVIRRNPADVALVTVMWANNEIGTIQPIPELVAVAREFAIPIHADAAAAFGQIPIDFAASGLDALSVTAHKIGGPHGTGALLLAPGRALVPLLHGGGQEHQARSGTHNAPAAAAFATAAQITARQLQENAASTARLRDALVLAVRRAVPDAILNGDPTPQGRLPSNAHFCFPGCDGDQLVLLLDAHGVACSTGSACSEGLPRPSHVLLAIGRTPQQARGSLRFTLGPRSTKVDVDALATAIRPAVDRARHPRPSAEVIQS